MTSTEILCDSPASALVAANDKTLRARSALLSLDEYLASLPAECRESMDTVHDFAPGIYARTIFMKRGVIYTSKIHNTEHFFVVAKGSCRVLDSHGGSKVIAAPYMGKTLPGTKRALLMLEDTIWTTFHATDLTDPDEIGRQILSESLEVPR